MRTNDDGEPLMHAQYHSLSAACEKIEPGESIIWKQSLVTCPDCLALLERA